MRAICALAQPARDAGRHGEHRRHQDHAVDDHAEVGREAQHLGQGRQGDAGGDHAPEAAGAADDHDDQEGLHVIEIEEQRIDDPQVEGEDAARRAGDRGADREGGELVGHRRDALRAHQRLVLLDGDQGAADARAAQRVEEAEHQPPRRPRRSSRTCAWCRRRRRRPCGGGRLGMPSGPRVRVDPVARDQRDQQREGQGRDHEGVAVGAQDREADRPAPPRR